MSWKRILEAARRNGIPLVVTDPDGREPMVILPLEQFEALSAPSDARSQSVEVRSEPSRAESFTPITSPVGFSEEAPLEEQFFLEPLEDLKNAE